MIVGSQLFRNHRFRRFIKNIVHSIRVTLARPSANSWLTENELDSCWSWPTITSSGTAVAGAIRERYSATLPWRPPLRTRNRMDSGKNAIRRIATTTGIRPPTRNTACQPNFRITAAATQPANAEPSENPQNIVMTAAFLVRLGIYSEVKAIAFGI